MGGYYYYYCPAQYTKLTEAFPHLICCDLNIILLNVAFVCFKCQFIFTMREEQKQGVYFIKGFYYKRIDGARHYTTFVCARDLNKMEG